MRRAALLFMLGLLLAGCGLKPTPDLQAEENAIYLALFQGILGPEAKLLVIEDHTSTFGALYNWKQTSQYIKENLPAVAPETLADFQARNAQPQPLKDFLSIPIPTVLFSEQERNEIFQSSGNGWDEFYRRYPGAPGLSAISRAGLNKDRTQAFVYIGTQSHYLAGVGYYVLLVKENGTWKVSNQLMAWIS